jgi:hypothetical protein
MRAPGPKRKRARVCISAQLSLAARCYGRSADGTLVQLFVTLDCAQHRLIARWLFVRVHLFAHICMSDDR